MRYLEKPLASSPSPDGSCEQKDNWLLISHLKICPSRLHIQRPVWHFFKQKRSIIFKLFLLIMCCVHRRWTTYDRCCTTSPGQMWDVSPSWYARRSFPFSIKIRWNRNYLMGIRYVHYVWHVFLFRVRNSRSSQMACRQPGNWFTTLGLRSALAISSCTWATAIASTAASSLPSNTYASWRRAKVGEGEVNTGIRLASVIIIVWLGVTCTQQNTSAVLILAKHLNLV